MKTGLLLLALFVATSAAAQSLQSTRMGGTTYYRSKTANGDFVTGTAGKLRKTTYSEFRKSREQMRCTTRALGSRTYTECR